MTEEIKNTLRDSKFAKWFVLGIISFSMFAGYLFADVIAPLETQIKATYGWSGSDYGFVTGAYAWFNVFFGMLIIVGIILDKKGIRFSTLMSGILMVVGAVIKYTSFVISLPGYTIFGIPMPVLMAAFGYAIFGVGLEYAGVTISKIVVKWFKGKELALSMGLWVSVGRLGSACALFLGPIIAKKFSVSTPIFIGVLLLFIGSLSLLLYNIQDKKLDKQLGIAKSTVNADDEFKMSDILIIVKNRGFWLISILCVLFYSSVFPFFKYASGLMINKYGISEEWSGLIPSLVPFGTILLTPIFGSYYDKKGKGASIMIIGSLILFVVHVILFLPIKNIWIIGFDMILLGIAFSLVPSAMWPAVSKIIPEKQLGTAFAGVSYVQNIGAFFIIPMLIGYVLDKSNPAIVTLTENFRLQFEKAGLNTEQIGDKIQTLKNAGTIPALNYSVTWFIFIGLAILALFFAFWLKSDDKRKGYGLELPNKHEN